MAHQWSGWPGCYCQKCGVEHALENALANNWFEIGEDGQETWKSEDHHELVNLCDNNCSATMTEEEFKEVERKCRELGDKIIEKYEK